jgi:hypothetical protein
MKSMSINLSQSAPGLDKYSIDTPNIFIMQCRWGRLDAVKKFFDKAEQDDKEKWLHESAEYGHIHIVSYLLSKGINVNSGENEALARAFSKNNYGMIQFLLSNGANPNVFRAIDLVDYFRSNELIDLITKFCDVEKIKEIIVQLYRHNDWNKIEQILIYRADRLSSNIDILNCVININFLSGLHTLLNSNPYFDQCINIVETVYDLCNRGRIVLAEYLTRKYIKLFKNDDKLISILMEQHTSDEINAQSLMKYVIEHCSIDFVFNTIKKYYSTESPIVIQIVKWRLKDLIVNDSLLVFAVNKGLEPISLDIIDILVSAGIKISSEIFELCNLKINRFVQEIESIGQISYSENQMDSRITKMLYDVMTELESYNKIFELLNN